MLVLPLMALSQNNTDYGIFENALLTPNPSQITQFEKAITAHNKKYHSKAPHGVRVYWVTNGPNTGSYVWVMGPFPWSSLDQGPVLQKEHAADWSANIAPYLVAGTSNQSYWRGHTELSRFPKDFTIKNMAVDYWDIKRGMHEDAMKLVKKINQVYAEKSPNDTYGIYTNEFPSTKEGKDLVVISFFDNTSWLGEDNEIPKKYEEKFGSGSWKQFLKDWMAVTNGGETEIWVYRPDLSGINGEVKVAARQ
ncbi:hypothetical protein INR76_00105 [Marixanthomonas sp. SCSIO 43207]|nr:hypothetical protein INR76_00105 [Marixanthomonas sp. SCSIO 43207]